jgi:hypothetical protein
MANFLNNGFEKTEIEMEEKKFKALLGRIGCGLSILRSRNGYKTMKDFATDKKLPFIQYWRIEKGKANITFKTLLTLLSIHQITFDEFFSLVKAECF